MPYREQNHREHFHQGDPVRAVLKRVEETPKGPRLILSRSDPLFVQALFKLEVPEIQQGIVEIRAAAREVGSRTKIAVWSRDESIDPVGACVGLKGARVQAVVNELNGERIDIVPWSSDPERFAKLALAPARVARVFSDPENRTIQAVVDEDQLSLAIGRNGQNVRLASELTGWKIDLYSSREWMERGGEGPLFAPLPPEEGDARATSSSRKSRLAGPRSRCWRGGLQDLQRHHRPRAGGLPPASGHCPGRGRSHHEHADGVDDGRQRIGGWWRDLKAHPSGSTRRSSGRCWASWAWGHGHATL
jgi:transcription antitermination factor NusA-like protein